MIIAAVVLVFGLGGAVIPIKIGLVEIQFVGMALAAIIGIILNILLPDVKDDEDIDIDKLEPEVDLKDKF